MENFKFIMFFVWAAAMVLTIWSVEVARMFARRVQKSAADKSTPDPPQWPPVVAILPIKGSDPDTEENIRALLNQDYPHFRLLFAVESAEDPAVAAIQKSAAGSPPQKLELITAGIATTRGQKIHNQLAALAATTPADQILVFLDADARPKPHWMRELVRPLIESTDVGATTGFRLYVPAKPTLPNAAASVINSAVAALLGPGWRNIAWGGSMAIRRADFFNFKIDQAWQNALSDDYVLSWCVKQNKKRIQFVQPCLVASEADFTWPAFWEFAARQYKITRICAPGVWLIALGAAALYVSALAYTLAFYLLSLLQQKPDHPLLLMFAALTIGNLIRGTLLYQGTRAALQPPDQKRLQSSTYLYTIAYPLSLAINLLALLKSALGTKFTWRNTTYLMHSRLKTTILSTNHPPNIEPPQ